MSEQKKKEEIKKNKKTKETKKTKKKKHIWLWVLLLLAVWWYNNYTLKVTKEEFVSDKVASKVRIAVISDQHATKYGISNDTIFSAVDRADPDIVFVLGDMYTSGSNWELIHKPVDLTAELVSAGYPVYCVTGEHDYDDRYVSELKKAGAKVLDYSDDKIEIKGTSFRIIGIDNVYYSPTFDLRNEYTLDDSSFNILLAHIPNYEKFADFGADLTLCADTHGEMAQLPFGGGPLYSSDKDVFLPRLLHKELDIYDKGFFDYEGGTMFITSGVGVYPVPVRFNNRPEAVIMDIIPKG